MKYYTSSSDFEFKEGCFVGKDAGSSDTAAANWTSTKNSDGSYTFSDGKGHEINISAETMAKMQASVFFSADGMNTETLTKDIDKVIAAASTVVNDGNLSLISGFAEYLAEKGINTTDKEAVARGLVLYVADNTKGFNASNVLTQIQDGTFATQFGQNLYNPSDKTTAVLDAAIAYSLVEAYANGDGGSKTITLPDYAQFTNEDGETVTKLSVAEYFAHVNSTLGSAGGGTAELNNILTMFKVIGGVNEETGTIGNKQFKNYLNNSGTDDLNGFLSAMDVISSMQSEIDMSAYLSEGLSGDYMTNLISLFKEEG